MFCGSAPDADKRFEDSKAYNDQHGMPIVYADAETYRVYVCSDTHVDFTRKNWETFIRDYHNDLQCPLALHLGDLINAQRHWDYMKRPLDSIPANPMKKDTLLAVVGNHDLYFNQWGEYLSRWKTSTYYAIVRTPAGKQDLYIFVDTGEGVLGSKQWAWLEQTLNWADGQSFRHIVVNTHTHLFKRDSSQGHTSNLPLEETYALLSMLQKHKVEMYWCGHDHSREISQLQNMTAIVLDALSDQEPHPSYLVAEVGNEPITYKFVDLKNN